MIVIFKDNLYTNNGFSAKLVPWSPETAWQQLLESPPACALFATRRTAVTRTAQWPSRCEPLARSMPSASNADPWLWELFDTVCRHFDRIAAPGSQGKQASIGSTKARVVARPIPEYASAGSCPSGMLEAYCRNEASIVWHIQQRRPMTCSQSVEDGAAFLS